MFDRFPDRLYNTGQFIRADMRVCIDQYVVFGPVFDELPQYLVNFSPFVRARVQFPVAVRAGTTFAETVVAVRVYNPELLDGPQVFASFANILAPVEHDGF